MSEKQKQLIKQQLRAVTEKRKGKLLAVASTEDEDRSGDSLDSKAWDISKFKENPVLQAGHDYRPQYTIGIAKNIRIEEGKLVFEPKFHTKTQLAKDIKSMYESDPPYLRAWSVGFIPYAEAVKQGIDTGGKEKNELLEVSAVAVPANAEALTEAKEYSGAEAKNYNNEKIQSIKKWISKELGDEKEKQEENEEQGKEEKSPTCKLEDETEEECRQRKIPEITDEGYDQDQAVAMAYSMCETPCSEQDSKTIKRYVKAERWNKQLTKDFDITKIDSEPSSFEYDLYSKFLNCKIKDIFINTVDLPGAVMLGNYLLGVDSIMEESKLELIDIRNFNFIGEEAPPRYADIPVNSEKTESLLIMGTKFYDDKNGNKLAISVEPHMFGIDVSFITTMDESDTNKEYIQSVHKWVRDNNYLKGEKFCLSGEFLQKSDRKWDDLILEDKIKEKIQKSVNHIEKENANSRGVMMMGYPGTGKTYTGKIVIDNSDATFIWVSSRDFKKVGVIGALSQAFKVARELAPSVLFLEDIDSWLRDGMGVDLLKTEMDGIQENKNVVTFLTSNNPEYMPKALLDRPGRFHEIVNFELPGEDIRQKMLTNWLGETVSPEILKEFAEKTEGYTGAYIKELVEFAEMIAEDEEIEMEEALKQSLDKIEEQRELINSLIPGEKSFEEDIYIKEGRVLSKKNRDSINSCLSLMKDTFDALEKLLEASEPSLNEGGEEEGESFEEDEVEEDTPKKERLPSEGRVNKLSYEEKVALRTLQKINKATNTALHYSKKRK